MTEFDRLKAETVLADLDKTMRHVRAEWEEFYPHGVCTIYSLLSVPILRVALDPDLRVVIGTYDDKDHCWIESTDSWVIDQTFTQFELYETDWIVVSPGARNRWRVEHVLSLDEEDYYRRTIHPSGNTKIKKDFWSRDLLDVIYEPEIAEEKRAKYRKTR